MTIDINELRRLAQAATPGPWKTGQYLGSLRQFVIHTDVGDKGRGSDVAFTSAAFGNDETVANARLIAAANPAAISELLDRLEAAEKERDALRTLVVMRCDLDYLPQFTQGHESHEFTEPVTAEHCRWFVAEIERLRTDCDALRTEAESWKGLAQQLGNELDALRAKIEQMEKQEPAGIAGSMPGTSGFTMACFSADEVPMGTKLYALPGAK